MHTTIELLDLIKTRLNLSSDNKLSKYIGVTRANISGYRCRGVSLGDETALWVADMLGMDHGYVLSCMAAERAKLSNVKSAWEALAKKASAAIFTIFIGSFAFSSFLPDLAKAAEISHQCILCKKRRIWRLRGCLLLLTLFCSFTAQAAETWTKKEIAAEGVFFTLQGADFLQTRWIARHRGYREYNPLLGEHPSISRINAVFAVNTALQIIIANALPHPWRATWIGFGIIEEGSLVAHNARIGIHLSW